MYLADLKSGEAIDEDDYPSDDDILEFFDDESDMSSGDESSDRDDKADDWSDLSDDNMEEDNGFIDDIE